MALGSTQTNVTDNSLKLKEAVPPLVPCPPHFYVELTEAGVALE